MDARNSSRCTGAQPSTQVTASGRALHAGVAVLSNRALWDLTTSFMAGYPHAVHKFYRESDATALETIRDGWYVRNRVLCGSLAPKGVLLHLAIAANDAGMLRLLFKLAQHPQYQRDAKLSAKKVMRCAVFMNRVEMLECAFELKAGGGGLDWSWEPNLMRIALQRDDPDVKVLDWLDAHLPTQDKKLHALDMLFHTKRGDLAVVRWLHERKRRISKRVMEAAAKWGRVEVLRYFYEHSSKRCNRETLSHVAELGHVEVVRLIVENQKREISHDAICWAATSGQLDVVKYFIESKIRLDAPYVIDNAAANGHLDVVKYLHEHHAGGCTAQAMHDAAVYGHLNIVKFLHENRTEGCSPDTLDRAVRNGHLEIVGFLHEHYALECTPGAFDRAAANGHLGVLQFLYHERAERGTANATSWAAKNGHVAVVQFLCDQDLDADIVSALKSAASHGHLEIVKLLHPRLETRESAFEAVVASRQHRKIAKFLCDNQEREAVRFLEQSVAKSMFAVVRAVWRYASVDELMDAKEAAVHQEKAEMAILIANCIAIKQRKAI